MQRQAPPGGQLGHKGGIGGGVRTQRVVKMGQVEREAAFWRQAVQHVGQHHAVHAAADGRDDYAARARHVGVRQRLFHHSYQVISHGAIIHCNNRTTTQRRKESEGSANDKQQRRLALSCCRVIFALPSRSLRLLCVVVLSVAPSVVGG